MGGLVQYTPTQPKTSGKAVIYSAYFSGILLRQRDPSVWNPWFACWLMYLVEKGIPPTQARSTRKEYNEHVFKTTELRELQMSEQEFNVR